MQLNHDICEGCPHHAHITETKMGRKTDNITPICWINLGTDRQFNAVEVQRGVVVNIDCPRMLEYTVLGQSSG